MFIPGRMITDNALIAFEFLHSIHTAKDERSQFCAYKLDLSKAYDRVDWGFLEKVLLKLGFQSQWVQRIMSCISSVCYTVRFNGVPSASFTPTRGLRQGDPLSPFFCSCLWQMVSPPSCRKKSKIDLYKISKFVVVLQVSHTCYLRMILFYSSKPMWNKHLW